MTERTDYQAGQPKGRVITDPAVRRWIYGIAAAGTADALAEGIELTVSTKTQEA